MTDESRAVLRRVTDAMVSADNKYREAFEAMRGALEKTIEWYGGPEECFDEASVLKTARAALALADKVSR